MDKNNKTDDNINETKTDKIKTTEAAVKNPETKTPAEDSETTTAKKANVEAKNAKPVSENPESKPTILDSTGKEYKTENTKPKNYATMLASLALICGLASLGFTSASYMKQAQITVYSSTDGNSAKFTDGSIAEVAARVASSVVSIVTETRTSSWYSSYSSSAAGTGFIVSADGYVVTNKHVISGAKSVKIILHDGTEYNNVQIVGSDPLNDAAVLKIKDAKDLPVVTLGNSKTVALGEQVIAIGNALGAYQNSVTSGIISGTGRSLTATDSNGSSPETLSDMIQTDAAINGGNSGGPLVNAAGEVIGINTAYASDSNNISFAIPITSVKGLIRDAIKLGKVQRAVLGVRYYSLNSASAKELGLENITSGAYISTSNSDIPAITANGAGAKAGLKENDIITAVNGTKIGSAGSLSTLIGEYSVGDTVQLTVYRDGETLTLNAALEAYAE